MQNVSQKTDVAFHLIFVNVKTAGEFDQPSQATPTTMSGEG